MAKIGSNGSLRSRRKEPVPEPTILKDIIQVDEVQVHPTPQEQVNESSYVKDTVSSQNAVPTDNCNIKALAEYVTGIPITVTFYHARNNDTYGRSFPTDFDRSLDSIHTSYLKIINFQMRLKNQMDFNYEPDSTVSTQTGEAVLYPYFVPTPGDLFIYNLPNNKMGLFKIVDIPNRLAIHDTTSHEIKFRLLEFLTESIKNKIEESVEEVAYFDIKRYLTDAGSLLTTNEVDMLAKARDAFNILANAYGEEFYNSDTYNTFVNDLKLYDPYLVEFITKVIEIKKMPGYPTQLIPDPVNWKRSFWFKLLDPKMVPDAIKLEKATKVLYKVNYRTARINALTNRHYIGIHPKGEYQYPPFRIPKEFDEETITVPMQITLFFEQGKVRPSALMYLANQVLQYRRAARFYYIPVILYLLKKLIAALTSGNEQIILDVPLPGEEVRRCEDCPYYNEPEDVCEEPIDEPCICTRIPECGGLYTDDDEDTI